jgi:hypothetical protein
MYGVGFHLGENAIPVPAPASITAVGELDRDKQGVVRPYRTPTLGDGARQASKVLERRQYEVFPVKPQISRVFSGPVPHCVAQNNVVDRRR